MKYTVKEHDGWAYGSEFFKYGDEVELTDEQYKRYSEARVKLSKKEVETKSKETKNGGSQV